MDTSPLRVVPLGPDDWDRILEVDMWAFAFDGSELDPTGPRDRLEWDRAFGVTVGGPGGLHDGRLGGIYAVYSLSVPLPGGAELPCAGLTWVGVHPQVRRRGVLTTMMRHHLDQVRARGEAVAALHASETGIYGRFGYGIATRETSYQLPRGAGLHDVPGAQEVRLRIDHADLDRYGAAVEACHAAARVHRPGMLGRGTPALQAARFDDQKVHRGDAERLKIVVAESDGGGPPRGYALFRRRQSWEQNRPAGAVRVRELVARDPAAARALWGCLLDLDLMTTVTTDERPPDDPLLHLLRDPRDAQGTAGDGIWVRLVDLPAALAARRYAAPVDAVLEVTDATCPWNAGRWRLTAGSDGSARCARTDDAADLALDVRELGSAYLGGTSLSALAAAGLVTGAPAVTHALAVAFSWPVAPACGWVF